MSGNLSRAELTDCRRAGWVLLLYVPLHGMYLAAAALISPRKPDAPLMIPLLLVCALALLGVWLAWGVLHGRRIPGALAFIAFLALSFPFAWIVVPFAFHGSIPPLLFAGQAVLLVYLLVAFTMMWRALRKSVAGPPDKE